jgi:hypothetical protein
MHLAAFVYVCSLGLFLGEGSILLEEPVFISAFKNNFKKLAKLNNQVCTTK